MLRKKLMLTNACVVCGLAKSKSIYPKKNILQCDNCGHIFALTHLSSIEYQEIYQHSYFHGEEYFNYIQDKAAIQKNFQARLQTILNYVSNTKDKNIFEIGSAYGFFLELAQKHFCHVLGVDLCVEAVQYANTTLGVKSVLANDDSYHDILKSEIDVLAMFDCIEHLPRPDLCFESVVPLIKAGGLVCLSTGDISSFNAKMRGMSWRLIHPPTHVHYFSKHTIKLFLERFGFEMIHCSYPGIYRSLAMMVNQLSLRWWNRPLISPAFRSRFSNWMFYLNLYDVMFVIAKKK